MADDALRDAHTIIAQAITDLRKLGIPVPMALYHACHALSHALEDRRGGDVLPFRGTLQ